jgi:hypothetical protein
MRHYSYFLKEFINQEHINAINEKLLHCHAQPEDINAPANGVTKTSNVLVVPYYELVDELEFFKDTCLELNRKHFGYDLHQTTGINTILYNTYSESNQGEYSWHWDVAFDEPFDIKLTALLNISQTPFTGGELSLFVSGEETIHDFSKPGSMLLFPSFVQHKVNPVTSGTRKTLTLFLMGPSWR